MSAGDIPTVFNPRIWIAPVETPWPSRSRPVYGPMPAGYNRYWGMVNGFNVVVQDPQQNIQTSDRGIIGQIGSGADGIQLTSQTRTPTMQLFKWLTKMSTKLLAPVATVGSEQPQTEIGFFDPHGQNGSVQRFQVVVEGRAEAGSLEDEEFGIVFVLPGVKAGGNQTIRLDDSGQDGVYSPSISVMALPRTVTEEELTGTGIAVADTDPNGRMTWYKVPVAA